MSGIFEFNLQLEMAVVIIELAIMINLTRHQL